jgi:hypothetical protein
VVKKQRLRQGGMKKQRLRQGMPLHTRQMLDG